MLLYIIPEKTSKKRAGENRVTLMNYRWLVFWRTFESRQWVKMAKRLPWHELEADYTKHFKSCGRGDVALNVWGHCSSRKSLAWVIVQWLMPWAKIRICNTFVVVRIIARRKDCSETVIDMTFLAANLIRHQWNTETFWSFRLRTLLFMEREPSIMSFLRNTAWSFPVQQVLSNVMIAKFAAHPVGLIFSAMPSRHVWWSIAIGVSHFFCMIRQIIKFFRNYCCRESILPKRTIIPPQMTGIALYIRSCHSRRRTAEISASSQSPIQPSTTQRSIGSMIRNPMPSAAQRRSALLREMCAAIASIR